MVEARVEGARVVGVVGVLCDILLHVARNPFSLTVSSDTSLMNSEFPVELMGEMIVLAQNFPMSGE